MIGKLSEICQKYFEFVCWRRWWFVVIGWSPTVAIFHFCKEELWGMDICHLYLRMNVYSIFWILLNFSPEFGAWLRLSCIWPICKGGTTDIKNEHDLAGKGKFHHIIICNWRVQFQPSVFWGCRICKAKLSLWQQRRDVKSMCLGRRILRLDSEHVGVGIVATVGELIGIDQYQLFDTRKDCVSSFNILPQKTMGACIQYGKTLKINQHIIPEVHQSSVILRLNSAWSHMGTTFHVKFGTYRPCKFKTRHELMDE